MFRNYFLILLMFPLASSAVAERGDPHPLSPCDPGLVGNAESEVAYQRRGERCEGIYKLEVGSLELRLESLTESFEIFNTTDPRDLEIAWSLPPGAEDRVLHLQANALLPRSFYRMDTAITPRPGVFEWPCDLLDQQGYGRDDLGVFGWLAPAKAEDPRVYLPLRIHQIERPQRKGIYELAFTPRGRLEEVYVSVYPAASNGKVKGPPVWADQALEYGQYLAGSPVFLDLPRLTASGYYRIEIKVTFLSGGSGSDHFIVYHEEPTK